MTFALDAGVLIGLLDPEDTHHAAATEVFSLGIRFLVHPVNLAEALIGPERRGRSLEAFEDLRRFGVVPETLGTNEALILAMIMAIAHVPRSATTSRSSRSTSASPPRRRSAACTSPSPSEPHCPHPSLD